MCIYIYAHVCVCGLIDIDMGTEIDVDWVMFKSHMYEIICMHTYTYCFRQSYCFCFLLLPL